MTEKIELAVDDKTSPGVDAVEKNLGDVAKAADKAEKELNQAAAAADKFGKEGNQSAKSAGMSITDLNQGLEILKKGFEFASRAVVALAADGSPAFQKLQEAVQSVQNSLLDLGNDPGIQEFADTLANGITQQVIPAINSLPDYWRGAQNAIADFTASAGESIGVFADGTVEALQEIQIEEDKLLAKRKEQAEIQRQREAVDGKLAAMSKQIAANDHLQQLAQMTDRADVVDMIDRETHSLRALAKEGRATREEQNESLKKIAVLQKRLIDIPREQAKAAQEAAKEAAKAAEQLGKEREQAAKDAEKAEADYQQKLQASVDAAMKSREAELKAMFDKVEKAKAELVQLIEKSQGGGKSLLDTARGQITPEQARAQLVKQAQDQARANFTFQGDDARAAGAARNRAVKEAGVRAFRDFNAGRTNESDIAGAQNALIQNAAQAARGRGQLDQSTLDALTQATQNQQAIVQTQQQQQQVIQQLQAALAGVGNVSRNTFANGRRMANVR